MVVCTPQTNEHIYSPERQNQRVMEERSFVLRYLPSRGSNFTQLARLNCIVKSGPVDCLLCKIYTM
jgi:hypothetical protein